MNMYDYGCILYFVWQMRTKYKIYVFKPSLNVDSTCWRILGQSQDYEGIYNAFHYNIFQILDGK